MRKLMLMAAMALVLPAAAQAQDGQRQMGGRGPMLNTVAWLLTNKAEFNATADQVAKIEAISKQFDTETEKLRAEFDKVREEMRGGADRQTIMQKMRPIRDELQKKDEAAVEEVVKLLNDDQKKTVKQLIEARREQMQNRRRNGAGAGIQRS